MNPDDRLLAWFALGRKIRRFGRVAYHIGALVVWMVFFWSLVSFFVTR